MGVPLQLQRPQRSLQFVVHRIIRIGGQRHEKDKIVSFKIPNGNVFLHHVHYSHGWNESQFHSTFL